MAYFEFLNQLEDFWQRHWLTIIAVLVPTVTAIAIYYFQKKDNRNKSKAEALIPLRTLLNKIFRSKRLYSSDLQIKNIHLGKSIDKSNATAADVKSRQDKLTKDFDDIDDQLWDLVEKYLLKTKPIDGKAMIELVEKYVAVVKENKDIGKQVDGMQFPEFYSLTDSIKEDTARLNEIMLDLEVLPLEGKNVSQDILTEVDKLVEVLHELVIAVEITTEEDNLTKVYDDIILKILSQSFKVSDAIEN